MAKIKPDFDSRNVKVIGLSVDPMDRHGEWAKDIEETQGHAPNYPIIEAPTPTSRFRSSTRCSPPRRRATCSSARWPTTRPCATWSVGPDKKVADPGLSDDDGSQLRRGAEGDRLAALTANHKVATPVNWKQGEDVIIAGSVSDDAAREIYPDGWESPKPYIRIVPQPR